MAKAFTISYIVLSINQNQSGAVNKLAIPLGLAVILLVVAIIFGIWAYSGKQDYQNNTKQKIAVAVAAAEKQQIATDAANNTIANEKPLQTYSGPSDYGSLSVQYPKGWSAYVAVAASADSGSSTPIDGYFQPGVVPDTQNTNNIFALRVQVLQQPYNQILQNFDSEAQQNQVTVNPYALPKVPNDTGVIINGQIANNIQGTMVVLPLRDTTLEIYTETNSSFNYLSTFNNTILPNFSFSP